jgi:hypothetical protein
MNKNLVIGFAATIGLGVATLIGIGMIPARQVSKYSSPAAQASKKAKEATLKPLHLAMEAARKRKDWGKIEQIQDEIESLYPDEKLSGAFMRAAVAIQQGDFRKGKQMLQLYFYGTPEHPTLVMGNNVARAWLITLAIESGDDATANQALDELLRENPWVPAAISSTTEKLNPKATSKSRIAQMYVLLSADAFYTGLYQSSTHYYDQARKVDPALKLQKGFKEAIEQFRSVSIQDESKGELFPMLRHNSLGKFVSSK